MRPFILVFLGGGIGSVARYALSGALQRGAPGAFPSGTFAVNLIGCFAVGLVGALGVDRAALSPDARVFLMVGLLGGFTTFSAYAWETLSLLGFPGALKAALYAGASVVLGVLGAWAGRSLGRIVP